MNGDLLSLLIEDMHTRKPEVEIIKKLINGMKTREMLEPIRKENGEKYKESTVRQSLTKLRNNNVIDYYLVTDKNRQRFAVWYIVKWNRFSTTWNARRKRLKRNIFNKANREKLSINELKSKK